MVDEFRGLVGKGFVGKVGVQRMARSAVPTRGTDATQSRPYQRFRGRGCGSRRYCLAGVAGGFLGSRHTIRPFVGRDLRWVDS